MPEAPVITVKQAARRIGCDPRTVSGVAIGMGIELMPLASGKTLTLADYERVKARVEANRATTAVTT
jgi:hypothetical protein